MRYTKHLVFALIFFGAWELGGRLGNPDVKDGILPFVRRGELLGVFTEQCRVEVCRGLVFCCGFHDLEDDLEMIRAVSGVDFR